MPSMNRRHAGNEQPSERVEALGREAYKQYGNPAENGVEETARHAPRGGVLPVTVV